MEVEGYFILYPGKDPQRPVQNSETKENLMYLEGKVAYQQQLRKGSALARMGQGNYLSSRSATDAS